MSDANRGPSDDETVSVARQSDRLCDRFEFLLMAGQAVTVGAFLAGQGIDPAHADPDLLRELDRLAACYDPAQRPTVAAPTAPVPPPAGPLLRPGAVLADRYELVQLIGEGGMGSVWRAQQTAPVKRPVALKVIKAGLDSKSVLARFDAERQALALMDHPNIARIHDGGVTGSGQPFFVMELVTGVPLTDYCDAKRLTVAARLHLFVAVCQAVQHAHQKGIIHRDLKPGNVLVTEVDGRPTPKVIDFGVAKATEQRLTDQSVSDTGAIVGTPAYMSPEQADPTTADIDTRTDVYALGVMLYELLTGSPPIDARQFKRGALLEVLRMVREVEPPRPSTKVSTADALPNIASNRNIDPAKLARLLRGELDSVVMKALEKDRARRYETANAFARDVQRYLADEVVEARPPTRRYRLRKFYHRHRSQVIAASLVLFALACGVIGTTVGLVEVKSQRDAAEEARGKEATQRGIADANAVEADKERVKAQAAETLAQREKRNALAVAAKSALDQGQQICEGGDVVRGLHVLAKALHPAVESEDAGVEEAIRYNIAAWLPQAYRLKGVAAGNHFAACMSPDGTVLVTGGEQTLECWDTTAFRKIRRDENTEANIIKLAWQPGGVIVAILCRDGTLRLWKYGTPLRTAKPIRVCNPMNEVPHGGLSFSRDGSKLLVGALGRAALLFDVAKGEPIGSGFFHGSTHADAVAISPDGTRVVVGTPNWSARVYDLASAKPLTPVIRTFGSNFCAGISPDGTKFFTGHHMDGSLQVWDMKTGGPVGTRIAPGGAPLAAQFSPDGQTILVTGWMALTRIWDWKTGRSVGSPIPVSGYAAAFTTNGTGFVLSSPGGGSSVWTLPDRGLVWTSERLPGSVHAFTIRPDSEELAISMSAAFTPDSDPAQTPFLRRYRIPTGEAVKPYLPARHSRFASSLGYSPDGRTLYCVEGNGVTRFDLVANREADRLMPPPPARDYGGLMLSDDGRFLAITGSAESAVYDQSVSRWVYRGDSERWNHSTLGFVPGTHRLLVWSQDKLLSRDFDAADAARATVLESPLGMLGGAALRSDGKAILIEGYGGKMVEFDIAVRRPTGFGLGNVRGPSHYTPDGRWLYTRDSTGAAAWHIPTRRKLGPYVVTGYGTPLGVTPNGEHLLTVDEGRRLQCWRVPKPIRGTPAEVEALVVARTGLANSDGNHLSVYFPPKPADESVARPPLVVTDYQEIHNAELPELKSWLAALPENLRPTHLTVQEGSNGKRFDALAIDDGTAAPFEAHLALGPDEKKKYGEDSDDPAMWAKGWSRSWCIFYYAAGTFHRHHLWEKGGKHDGIWPSRDKLAQGLTDLRTKQMRPIGVVDYEGSLFLHAGPDDGRAWEFHHDLTAQQVQDKLTDARKRKWRPTLIHRHRTEADKFALVLIDNPRHEAWEYHVPMTPQEYEKKLTEGRAKELRPQYVQSWVENDKPVYSALWVGDYRPAKPPPELAPSPRPAK